jgi:vitamin K-dependent gamma-carboxylase
MATSLRASLSRLLGARVDIASLVVFRVIFGLLMIEATARFAWRGWITEYFHTPRYFFTYHGFEWVRPWPAPWMHVHYAVMGLCAAGIALGFFYRVSAALFFLLFTYAHLIDKTNYLNHYYLVSLLALLVVFMPLHAALSLDARRRPEIRRASAPALCLWLLRFQIGAVYFFGGVAKLKPDWIVHAQPLTIWLGASTEIPLLGPLFDFKATARAMSVAGLVFDLSAPFLLSWRRARPFAYAAVVAFHLLTARLFNLGMFPWLMIAFGSIFFPPSWPRRWLPARWLPAERAPEPEEGPASDWLGSPLRKAALAAFMGLQILLPLRHWLYPGNPCWTEEGFRFSWNVMLMEKNGDITFTVTDPATAQTWIVDLNEYLTRQQIRMMSTQPDMILAFAHHLADDFRRRGRPGVEVRADAHVSLNGRPPQQLIDPSVDLTRHEEGLHPKRWILPLAEARPRL